jgi:membrane protein required for beta-lactamase induction
VNKVKGTGTRLGIEVAKKIYGEYGLFVLCRVLAVLIQLAAILYMANNIRPVLYGEYSLLLTLPVIVNQTLFGPLRRLYKPYLDLFRARVRRLYNTLISLFP